MGFPLALIGILIAAFANVDKRRVPATIIATLIASALTLFMAFMFVADWSNTKTDLRIMLSVLAFGIPGLLAVFCGSEIAYRKKSVILGVAAALLTYIALYVALLFGGNFLLYSK